MAQPARWRTAGGGLVPAGIAADRYLDRDGPWWRAARRRIRETVALRRADAAAGQRVVRLGDPAGEQGAVR